MNADVIITEQNYDPSQPIVKQALVRFITARMKAKKNVFILLTGTSGDGKSWTALKIASAVEEKLGSDFDPSTQVVSTIPEYAKAFPLALKTKRGFYVLIIDEIHELMNAKDWQDFINKSVNRVNTTFRQIKRMCVIINAPSLRWITKDMREYITLYAKVRRPLDGYTKAIFNVIYTDDSDIEKVKLRRRGIRARVFGRLTYIRALTIYPPAEDKVKALDEGTLAYKEDLAKRQFEDMMEHIQDKYHFEEKVDRLVEFYIQRPEQLSGIVRRGKIRKDVRDLHKLNPKEFRSFKNKMMEKLAEKGLAEAVGVKDGK